MSLRKRVARWFGNLLVLIVLPTSASALCAWLGASNSTALVVALLVFAALLAYFLMSRGFWERSARRGSGMAVLILAVSVAVLLSPSSSSARPELDIEKGGFEVGPIVPAKSFRPWPYGENPTPPAGCRKAHVWSTGRALMGGYVAYRFHMRVTWCWSYKSLIRRGSVYENISGRHFTRTWVHEAWWTDARGVKYDANVQYTKRRFECQIGATVYPRGCFYARAVGQVTHPAIPLLNIGEIPDHPWAEIQVYADGRVKEVNHDRSIT